MYCAYVSRGGIERNETNNKINKQTKFLTKQIQKTISVKNFTKLLMAVVLLATYSCVQDSTEDLAPAVSGSVNGSGEVKTLQVALPNPTRTEMGDKVDGKYPVFWSEDDVLAVNGEPTTKISINEGDKSVAVFDLPLGSTIPYHIVYPYPGEDVAVNSGSGLYPVVFAVNQQHTEGTFAQGSAPMYTWSDGFSDIQMHHLSTILRFPIKAAAGQTVDLKYVSVSTVDAEPIAGVFDVYCGSNDENDPKTGTIAAREGSTSTVFYNFENDSYTLDENGAVFYIAVPYGSYSGFEVNFVANNGQVCVRTFKGSEEYALVAGRVREFPDVEFSGDSHMYLIGSDAEMLSFAESVKNGTFNATYAGALLTADIDVTGKGLKTIEGYTSVFEGRDHTIKGLTEPLFGENVTAQISNLNIEGNIVEESNPAVGLIARSLAVGGKIFNCSVAGSIDYKNPNITVNSNYDLVNVGGAVGTVYGAEVSIVKSDVNVTVSVAGPDGELLYNPCFGGVVGYACASGESLPVVSECTSNGAIVWADASNNTLVTPYIGGVAGYVTAGTFADNVNAGNLEVNEAMHDLDWGGVIGASSVSIERCVNKGLMTINQQVTTANIGGVIGKLEANTNTEVKNQLVDCENSGKVVLNENFKIVTKANIGGVAAVVEANTALVSGCYNSGSITYLGECSTYQPTATDGNTVLHLGGVVGVCSSDKVANCGNKSTGVIDVRGSLSGNSVDKDAEDVTGIAGVIGSRLGAGTTENCQNDGNVTTIYTYCGKGIVVASGCIGVVDSDRVENCNNTGKVYVETTLAMESAKPTPTSSHNTIYVSAIVGFVKSACDIVQCDNSGKVEFDNGDVRTIYISAINSLCKNVINIENCSNSGDVVVGEKASCWYVYAGGVLATTKYISDYGGTFPYVINKGNVIVKNTVLKIARVGGIFGDSSEAYKSAEPIPGVQNSGRVTFSGTAENLYLGGYAGYYKEKNHPVEFVNTSSGVITFDGRATADARVGGYAGFAELTGVGNGFNATNRGNVVAKGFSPKVYFGGAMGYATLSANGAVTGLKNEGVVEFPAQGETEEFPTTAWLGGIVGYASFSAPYTTAESASQPARSLAECVNDGEVRYHALVTDGAYIGGIVGQSLKTPIYNCENNGRIVSTGNAGDLVSRQFESKDKALFSQQLHDHDLAIGGIVGETDANVLSSVNKATIEHTCNPNPLKIDQWGEMASSRFDIGGVVGRAYVPDTYTSSVYAINLANLTNEETGKITIYGSPECTKQTSSLDWTSDATQEAQSADIDDPDRTNIRPFYRMNLSGIVGRIHDHSEKNIKYYLTNCTNRADITIPDAPDAKMTSMAGVLADVLASETVLSSCYNHGDIKIDNTGFGTSLSTAVRYHSFYTNMGGIVATLIDVRVRKAEYKSSLINKSITFNQCQNWGDIYYGENRASFNQCAGGILGQALHIVTGRTGSSSWSTAALQIPYSNMTINMNQCENRGAISFYSKAVSLITSFNGTTFAGGMVGNCGQANNSMNHQSRYAAISLNITGCKNYGDIQFDRSNGNMSPNTSVNYNAVGGLVGYYFGSVGVSDPALTKYNGNITVDTAHNMVITSGENHGRIWGFSGYIGGIVGRANWYVKITGTEAAPTINTGDVVVARNEEAGGAVRRTGYGTKVIYAGGIAGALYEQYSDTRFMGQNTGTNEGWPAYTLGSHYCRVENAINKGAVGATSIAGGIVGDYRCFYAPTKEIAPSRPNKGGIENCTNIGDVYALEGATSQVGAIVGAYRTMTITEYTSYQNSETAAVAAKSWPVGVFNCKIGGTILRGANRYTAADAENYMNVIYGENWQADEFVSLVSGKGNEYDGCKLYTAESEEDGGEEEPMAVRR